jgi:hypothetical protein
MLAVAVPNPIDARLSRIRGDAPPVRHNARTIAALTGNPGCTRRAVLDAAGVDKDGLARHIGYSASFGQSPFAIARGNAFEAQVKADGGAELVRLLLATLGRGVAKVEVAEVEYANLGARDDPDLRHARSRDRLLRAAEGRDGTILFDHPLLRLDVGGQAVYLEPDLVAFQHAGVFHVVEIKSFPVIDGQADAAKVAAAAIQSAVYVLAMRRMLGRPEAVSHEVVLVCPKDFASTPTATRIDVRRQLIVLEHQLGRLARIETLIDALPPDLSLDPAAGSPVDVIESLGRIPARYVPGCLSTCELAYLCRDQSAGRTATLGTGVREDLGGVDTVAETISLAAGTLIPTDDRADAAALLRTAARIYSSASGATP